MVSIFPWFDSGVRLLAYASAEESGTWVDIVNQFIWWERNYDEYSTHKMGLVTSRGFAINNFQKFLAVQDENINKVVYNLNL